MSKYKDSLADVVAGDTVVYVVPGYAGTTKESHECAVSRVTKTRVMVSRPRDGKEVPFARDGGREIGGSAMYRDRIVVGKDAEKTLGIGRRNMMLDEIRGGIFRIERGMKEREPNLHLELTRVEEIAANLRKLIEMNSEGK